MWLPNCTAGLGQQLPQREGITAGHPDVFSQPTRDTEISYITELSCWFKWTKQKKKKCFGKNWKQHKMTSLFQFHYWYQNIKFRVLARYYIYCLWSKWKHLHELSATSVDWQRTKCEFRNLESVHSTRFSKVKQSLLTASTRFTTDLAKFLVCCLLLCRLYCKREEKRQRSMQKLSEAVYFCLFGWNHKVKSYFTYHTVVNDNHNLQVLCLVKYAAGRLRNKSHQSLTAHRLFSTTTTGTGRLLLKSVASLQRDTRSKTYCPLFPALQPREFIELREELLLRNCEYKHVYKYT